MYDIKWIRENASAFDQGLVNRRAEPLSSVVLGLDDARKKAISENQAAQERRNALSKEIGQAMGRKDLAAAEALKAEVARLKDAAPELERAEREATEALHNALAAIPNMPQADVPVGSDEHGNAVLRVVGDKPALWAAQSNMPPKEHWELGEALGMMDFETAAKLSGARFVVLKGGLARLERALGQFFLDTHTTEHGYTEVNPPLLVRDDAMFGTAQLPKFREDQFAATSAMDPEERDLVVEEKRQSYIKENGLYGSVMRTLSREHAAIAARELRHVIWDAIRDLPSERKHWLIPTAEVPLTNLVSGKILTESELPVRVTALTPCFRAEAGSAGRDTKGMLRQHQFSKVELVSITRAEDSDAEHLRMLASAEAVLKKLRLHYRVMTLCTGDMGFASTKTYDIEVWLPGQNTYREISSCSNCGEFQARRMNARVRGADGKSLTHVHTLNGSGVAVGRALIAVMENYQNA
ncbi:MAG: serine--tRNA ligase, partial [Hyphomicrobiales bacterium]|nr:serine--tRNA ligase [Hyphomicrobiales bacterium]